MIPRRWFLAAISGVMLAVAALLTGSSPAMAQQSFTMSSVEIDTAAGGHFRFKTELAETQAQHQQGLMYRRVMAPDAGMLFIFDKPQQAAFWMKNTFIPLDMLFVAADGRIASIHANAVPQSEATIPSNAVIKAVLEINGGMAARLGIRPGDTVKHATFGNGP